MKTIISIILFGIFILNTAVGQTVEGTESILNVELIAILDAIHLEDQQYRGQIKDIEKKHGWQSEEMRSLWEIINEKDSINLIKVKKILDEKGWLGEAIVGKQGNSTLFLVIQHANLKTQEKYLPMMRKAVADGNARPSSFALLQDRVALRQGKKQIYGSQISQDPTTGEYYISPLKDPDNVDLRRESVGLGKLKNYVSIWGIVWDIQEYKAKLSEYKETEKLFVKDKRNLPQELGINLLQIPATTLDLTYTLPLKPNFSVQFNSGYTFNYAYSIDLIGFFLSPHYKCGNFGFVMKNQSGGYLKLGMKYNFRKTFDKNNYFFFGGYLSSSLVYEKAEYTDMDIQDSPTQELSHSVFIYGFSGFLGYNFKLSEKLNADFGVQISVPSKAYDDLYGYTNFIPGMGYMETAGEERIFPMVFFNLKYKLK